METKPELNREQQAAAFCMENAVVAAGAGSGKTMVLASRFAWLVTEKNYRVNEILTLTFTNKAAAQMFRRIHSTLGEIASTDNGEKGRRAQAALDDFVHARIQTLDSYSAAIVRQCASRYGINPDFVIDQERCLSLAFEEALPFLISHRRHPALERIYSKKQPNEIAHDIFASILFNYSYIDRGPSLIEDTKNQFDIVCREWKKLRDTSVNILDELQRLASEDEKLHPDLPPLMTEYAIGQIVFPDTQNIRDYFDMILSLPADTCIMAAEKHPLQDSLADILRFMAKVHALNLSKGRRKDNPVKDLIRQFRSPVFEEFSSLAVYCMQAGLIYSFMTLTQNLQEHYLNKKRQEGILTFSDVSRLARAILIEQSDIRKSEKETFKTIMIDEFQDNNELQKDVLFLLAEKHEVMSRGIPAAKDIAPDKLFFVGDEKQSIYLFRGADVSVFRTLQNELQSAGLSLAINYRSSPDLIGAFNAVFGGGNFDPSGKTFLPGKPSVFVSARTAGAGLPPYEAVYTPLEAGKTGGGKMSVCIFDDKNNETDSDDTKTGADSFLPADENEARFVAERVKKLLEKKNESGENQYRPNDIAILFRTRNSQHLFEKHLRLLNIPYACEDMGGFFFGGPVNDIMSALRLAAYPLDKAAYAEMLRSPFAGLSLPGLAACLAVFNQSAQPEPFTGEPLARLSESDQSRYIEGQKLYRRICGKARESSVSALVSELWYNEGYRYETEWNPQTTVYRELYDYLFHLAVKADTGNQGLSAFADSIQELRNSGGRLTDIEIPLERSNAVQLLTIHKSKGLEFPVVFLCGCGKHGRTDQSGDVYDTGGAGIALSPPLPSRVIAIPKIRNNFFWERSNAEAKRKRTAELRRLLYVGMTRAEKELHLSGSLKLSKNLAEDDTSARDENTPVDFSLLLKQYVEEKAASESKKSEEKNTIPGDSIFDNDTFFGLCLPALAAHIPAEGCSKDSPLFFSIEEIPVFPRENTQSGNTAAGFSNDNAGLRAFFEQAKTFYDNAEKITTPEVTDNHLTPTSLRDKLPSEADRLTENLSCGIGLKANEEFSGENGNDIFNTVDAMLANFAQTDEDSEEKFNAGSFGTIAHLCVESLLNSVEPFVPASLSGFLSPKESTAFLDAGKELAARFIRSPLGKIAQNAELRENEFPFRTLIKTQNKNELFINGTIDLLFEDTGTVHVVDFKTDSRENPAEHAAQMACYYQAASALFADPRKKTCRIWLYYLRSGHAVEITGKAQTL